LLSSIGALSEATATAASVDGVLVVAPGAHAIAPGTNVAGVPLVRRIVLAARRAGFERILVHDDGRPARLLDGTGATDLATDVPKGRRRIVILAADIVPQPRWFRALLAAPLEPATVYTDAPAIAMIDSYEPDRVLAVVRQGRTAAEMIAALRGEFPALERAFEPSGRFPLSERADVARAEGWLLRSLIKRNEGFMSRHFERRVSLAITRRLVPTEITPNTMTVISLVIGLSAAPLFVSTASAYQLVGALLFLLHSILDGCDGEIARLKFLETRAGAVLDFWGDNVVHVAVFGCIAVGWSLQTYAAWPLIVGAVSVVSTLAAAAAVSTRTMADRQPAGGRSLTGRLLGALAHRDFIYVLIVLSALGKASWFLMLSAVGTPLFLMLLFLSGRGAESASDE